MHIRNARTARGARSSPNLVQFLRSKLSSFFKTDVLGFADSESITIVILAFKSQASTTQVSRYSVP